MELCLFISWRLDRTQQNQNISLLVLPQPAVKRGQWKGRRWKVLWGHTCEVPADGHQMEQFNLYSADTQTHNNTCRLTSCAPLTVNKSVKLELLQNIQEEKQMSLRALNRWAGYDSQELRKHKVLVKFPHFSHFHLFLFTNSSLTVLTLFCNCFHPVL